MAVAGAWLIGHVTDLFLNPPTKQQTKTYEDQVPGWTKHAGSFVFGDKAATLYNAVPGGSNTSQSSTQNLWHSVAGGNTGALPRNVATQPGGPVNASVPVPPGAGHEAGFIPGSWSKSYEEFQRDFAGKITAWFTKSLPDAFTKGIPNRLWSPAYEHFQKDFAGKITNWFTVSLPNAFTQSVPRWFAGAFGHFQSAVIAPIRGFVTATLPGFFTQTIPDWFSSAVGHFQSAVIAPVKGFITRDIPGFFTSTIPHWFSSAWGAFTSGVLNPVKTFVTSTLPGFFTSTIPRWFSGAVRAFTSGVVTPVRTFVTSTLPGFSPARSRTGSAAPGVTSRAA